MREEILALLAVDSNAPAVRRVGGPDVDRGALVSDVRSIAASLGRRGTDPAGTVWVAVRDRYLALVSALAGLNRSTTALVESEAPAARLDALARSCPPSLVLTDQAAGPAARWAAGRGVPRLLVRAPVPAGSGRPASAPLGAGRHPPALRIFTSGTTGNPKCVTIGASQLAAAVNGVAGRLGLTSLDVSLSVAPMPHTLGFVTSVLAALAAGGTVAFADLDRGRDVCGAITGLRPTWCAASPSTHELIHALVVKAGIAWPSVRFLRSSSAPIRPSLVAALQARFGVPVVNAYAMTEAPGEIASQSLADPGPPGSVGRPTLCEVRVVPGGAPAAGPAGEIWIRGPNVVTGDGSWLATGDVGELDGEGVLLVAGRRQDVINQGGIKIWPPDIEAVVMRHPDVETAVAFPVPHASLGETVGLAVVPVAGRQPDRRRLRGFLAAELPRHELPRQLVVCDDIPLTARRKVDRRGLWRVLGVRPGEG